MEEILASIRQIIESNEPGAGKALSVSPPPVYGANEDDRDSDIHLTVDQAYAGVEFPEVVPQPDPRFVAANSAGSAPALEAPARAMSLADVAARVRAASERNTVQLQREVPPGFRQQQEMRVEVPAHMFEVPQPPIEMPPVVETSVPSLATTAPQAVTAAEKPVEPPYDLRTAAATLPHADVAFAPQLSERMLSSTTEDTQHALISQDAGLQIARSFEELAAAIDGAERRSLDEIAEDMLRPMLRDWLDDNLPTLVERLVREEIERVARGPRR
jgi:cell pole-organizing protein PopZ